MKKTSLRTKVIMNPSVRYNYRLGNKIIAGISLNGREVFNIRRQRVSLKTAFVQLRDNELWLHNLQIFTEVNQESAQPAARNHRLLVTKAQLKSLSSDLGKHNTIIPVRFILGNYIKIEIAPALGKKQYDKREVIKKKESERNIRRQLKINKGGR